jgi:hypothetical protein
MRPGEESSNLGFRLPYGGGAGNDFGPEAPPFSEVPLSQVSYSRFVNPGDGAERTRNEMQFVLDDEFRGEQRPAERLAAARFGSTVKAIVIDPLNMPKEFP